MREYIGLKPESKHPEQSIVDEAFAYMLDWLAIDGHTLSYMDDFVTMPEKYEMSTYVNGIETPEGGDWFLECATLESAIAFTEKRLCWLSSPGGYVIVRKLPTLYITDGKYYIKMRVVRIPDRHKETDTAMMLTVRQVIARKDVSADAPVVCICGKQPEIRPKQTTDAECYDAFVECWHFRSHISACGRTVKEAIENWNELMGK